MNNQLLICPIKTTDNKVVAQIIRTVMKEFDCVGEGYSINDPEVDQMFENYDNPRSAFFVVSKDEVVQGCAGIGPLANGAADICELKKMYFSQSIRGLGLGKRMLELCLEKARQLGYRQCYLETVERMNSANALYQKMGFRPLENRLGNTGHGSCDAYYLLDL